MSTTVDTTAASTAGKERTPLRPARIVLHVFLVGMALAWLAPLLWALYAALRPYGETSEKGYVSWPDTLSFDNFTNAFTQSDMTHYFVNTLIIAVLVIIGDLLSCSLVAYGFARFRFPGREVLFLVLLSTLMVPFIVRLVPLFVAFQKVGWINTFWPLVAPAFFGTPLFIFLMRQFFMTIPSELIDAARIDGANELQVWWRIMVPLSKPVRTASTAGGM